MLLYILYIVKKCLKLSALIFILKANFFNSSGTYEISNAEGVQPGTKIVLHLRVDCREFSDDDTVNSNLFSF